MAAPTAKERELAAVERGADTTLRMLLQVRRASIVAELRMQVKRCPDGEMDRLRIDYVQTCCQ